MNHALVEGGGLSINVRGTSSLPLKADLRPDLVQAFFEVTVPLPLLNKLSEDPLPEFQGQVTTAGTLSYAGHRLSGKGTVNFKEAQVDDYAIGSGDANFSLSNEKLSLKEVVARYSEGIVRSSEIALEFRDNWPLSADLQVKGMTLQGLLKSLMTPANPVRGVLEGEAKLTGTLKNNFQIKLEVKTAFEDFKVIEKENLPSTGKNIILTVPKGTADGTLIFTLDKMTFDAGLVMIGGRVGNSVFVVSCRILNVCLNSGVGRTCA